jgi:hypothetical protein
MGVEAWYMDDSSEDQRLPHRQNPNKPATKEQLDELGVLQWHLDDADKFVYAEHFFSLSLHHDGRLTSLIMHHAWILQLGDECDDVQNPSGPRIFLHRFDHCVPR